MPHLPPAHHETSKHHSPHDTNIKVVEPPKCPGIKFKPRQVNDPSQSNQGTDHLISHDDKEVDDSDEEYVMASEPDLKHQARQPKDPFQKLVEATCQNYSYLVKHKLQDCTMMKNITTMGVLSRGRKPKGDLLGKGVTPNLGWRRS
jgi:hypothetical protein